MAEPGRGGFIHWLMGLAFSRFCRSLIHPHTHTLEFGVFGFFWAALKKALLLLLLLYGRDGALDG